jgi:hypothetical protein
MVYNEKDLQIYPCALRTVRTVQGTKWNPQNRSWRKKNPYWRVHQLFCSVRQRGVTWNAHLNAWLTMDLCADTKRVATRIAHSTPHNLLVRRSNVVPAHPNFSIARAKVRPIFSYISMPHLTSVIRRDVALSSWVHAHAGRRRLLLVWNWRNVQFYWQPKKTDTSICMIEFPIFL